jgi:hypothetical protein
VLISVFAHDVYAPTELAPVNLFMRLNTLAVPATGHFIPPAPTFYVRPMAASSKARKSFSSRIFATSRDVTV